MTKQLSFSKKSNEKIEFKLYLLPNLKTTVIVFYLKLESEYLMSSLKLCLYFIELDQKAGLNWLKQVVLMFYRVNRGNIGRLSLDYSVLWNLMPKNLHPFHDVFRVV
jgi:hypothetical protein